MPVKRDRRVDKTARDMRELNDMVVEDLEEGIFVPGKYADLTALVLGASRFAGAVDARGQSLLLKGDFSGWLDIERAELIRVLAYRLLGIYVPRSAIETAQAVLHLAAYGVHERFGRLGAEAIAGAEYRGGVDIVMMTPAMALWAASQRGWFSGHLDETPAPFDSLLSVAADDLDDVLTACAEYRLANAYLDDSGTDEFMNIPLMPVETWAVLRIQGLELVSDHPLYQTPLSRFPAEFTFNPKDEPFIPALIEAGIAEGKLDPSWKDILA